MKIQLHNFKVKDVFTGYADSEEEGVVGYGGRLDIRPKYQREFVYDEKKRAAVIDTINKGFPLNVMYWVKTGDDTYEVLDGQQRTISFCQYLNGDFSFDGKYAHNLTPDQREKIENYDLFIYICEGTDSEKLDWFKIINIAGEKLTDQELRNAVYAGPWLTDAKRHFSKTGCPAYGLAEKYMSGSPIRQDYLESALKWISNGNITEYTLNPALLLVAPEFTAELRAVKSFVPLAPLGRCHPEGQISPETMLFMVDSYVPFPAVAVYQL